MTETDTTEDALAAGLLGVDASRRVGWAKAFDRARHIEDLEQQVSALQSELATVRRHYIRLFAFTRHLSGTRTPILDAELRRHDLATSPYFNGEAFKDGKREAEKHRAILGEWDEVDTERSKVANRVQRQLDAELKREAEEAGHDARFDPIGLTGRFACSCSCGAQQEVADVKYAFGWTASHRAMTVHGGLNAYRKLRKKAQKQALTDAGLWRSEEHGQAKQEAKQERRMQRHKP